MTRHTFNENIIRILILCCKPVSLHYVKDSFGFNNDRLKTYINELVNRNLVNIVDGIGRNNKKARIVTITGLGKMLLKKHGVKY